MLLCKVGKEGYVCGREANLLLWCCTRKNLQLQRKKNVAAHTGMLTELVPSPLPHPPPPPGFCVSTSQLQSPENAPTFGSVVREETPDETISRVDNGVFRCHENATTSGGGTYSPPQEEFPLF